MSEMASLVPPGGEVVMDDGRLARLAGASLRSIDR